MYDLHIHTAFSPDSAMTMSEAARAAESAGLDGICFTDHVDIDYPYHDWKCDLDLSRYRAAVESTREETGLPLYYGIEVGLQPDTLGKCSALVRGGRFDYVIASLHVFAGEDPCYREFYERYTRSDIIKLILAETIKCLKDYSDYCALGHLDYGLSFAQNAAVLEYAEAPSLLDELLLHLIRSSKGLEVNTSGYRRSGNTLPSPSVLKRYFDLGGEIITLGSDAHRAEHVGYRFSDAAAMLKSIGFKYTAYFKDMKPYFVPMT